jgi:hypothetical protein
MADTKSSKGLAATGVGTVDCARHGMKLPCGVVTSRDIPTLFNPFPTHSDIPTHPDISDSYLELFLLFLYSVSPIPDPESSDLY